ncbi:MAG: ribosome small subunit-dependent GTPase A [Rikenellaceae bacterium]
MPNNSGIVICATGSRYDVLDSVSGEKVECRIRGKLRLKGSRSTSPVVVGDRVSYEIDKTGEAVITDISERQNYIIRRSSNLSKESHIIAANIDQAFLVVTLHSPKTSFEFIDRFLVTSAAYKIPATIILNKVDTLEDYTDELENFMRVYSLAGYEIIKTCALDLTGISEIKDRLKDKTSLFSGNSGVGKSSLIRAIEPSTNAKVGEISSSHNKGKHTTTYSTVYTLSEGGFIIDTPGIKGFGLIDIATEELYRYFPDIMKYSHDCKFYNCTHLHEPGCAVERAIVEGKISIERYESYLKILEEDGKHRK